MFFEILKFNFKPLKLAMQKISAIRDLHDSAKKSKSVIAPSYRPSVKCMILAGLYNFPRFSPT